MNSICFVMKLFSFEVRNSIGFVMFLGFVKWCSGVVVISDLWKDLCVFCVFCVG